MLTRFAWKTLHALSTWLENLAVLLGASPATGRNSVPPPSTPEGYPEGPPVDWLARTQPQPPAHWLEHIRRASTGQPLEIHARPQPYSSGEPVIRSTTATSAKLPVPPGVARPVLRLAGTLHSRAPGKTPEALPRASKEQELAPPGKAAAADIGQQPTVSGVESGPGGPARMPALLSEAPAPTAPSFAQRVFSILTKRKPERPTPGEQTEAPVLMPSTPPAAERWPVLSSFAQPVQKQLGLPASPIAPVPQRLTPAQPGPVTWPKGKRTSPSPAIQRWPELLPVQPPFTSPTGWTTDTPARRRAAPQDLITPDILPVPGQKAFDLSSGHWPDLPPSDLEPDDWERIPDTIRQQLERHQRLDQEQRGSLWNP